MRLDRKNTEQIERTIFAIVVALLIVSIIFVLVGFDPVQAYASLIWGSLGTASGLGFTTVQLVPLILTGLASAVAFRGGLWNIGAEGQLYLGAIAAELVGIVAIAPGYLHWPMAIIAGFLGGAAGGCLAGALKAHLKIDEMVSTIMMNFVFITIVQYLVTGPIKDPQFLAWVKSVAILPSARIPFGTTTIFALAVAITLVIFVLMEKTTFGFEARVLGSNPLAAAYVGVKVKRMTILLMSASGGIAGLAGAFIVGSITYWLTDSISRSYGYVGIAVAILAGLNPLLVIPAALLFAVLFAGGNVVMANLGMSAQTVALISAVMIVSFVVSGSLLARIRGVLSRRKT
jgi:simple sugar transport system permease protein